VKELIGVPIHKTGDKTERRNYQRITLLPTSYKILPNILLSRIIPYADEIIGDYQCGFRRGRSMTDQIYIRQIVKRSGSILVTVHQLFTIFKKAYDSVRRELLCNILTEFRVLWKLVRFIKLC
jgi:hypothetical protein